jgi:hypothetical protein
LSKLTKTEKIKLYGLPLSDFLNSSTPTVAYFKLVEKIQKLFNYSNDFVNKVKKEFPEPLNRHERAYLKLVDAKYKLIEYIKDLLYDESLSIRDYDIEGEVFTLFEFSDYGGDFEYEGSFIFNLNRIDNICGFDSGELFIKKARALLKIEKTMGYIQSVWDDINYLKFGPGFKGNPIPLGSIKSVSYPNLSESIHNQIKKTQRVLSSIMKCIIEGKSLKSNKDLSRILFVYNEFEPHLKIKNDGSISREPSFFPEESFIIKDLFSSAYKKFNNPAFRAISFLLIKFLMLPNSTKLIHQCDECREIYISITIKSRRFCSDKCRLSYHNRKRIESGEAKEYKRKKRMEGAKESYYG